MSEVAGKIREFLARVVPPVVGDGWEVPAETALLPLAFAEGSGLPAGLWRVALRALDGEDLPEAALSEFGVSVAAVLLVESEGEGPDAVFRLSNQAVRDVLREAATDEREQALTRAFLAAGQDTGWDRAPAYLLRSLPAHAARAELVDELLADDGYLLHADLDELEKVADDASAPAGKSRARLLRRSPRAVAASPAERAAMFSITEAMENLGTTYREGNWPAPYRARWAVASVPSERGLLRGHDQPVTAVRPVTVDGRRLLASGDRHGGLRLWDPRDGSEVAAPHSDLKQIWDMCTVTAGGRDLLGVASGDNTVRLVDPRDGSLVAAMEGHQEKVYAVCAITVDGRDLLASGDYEGTVRLWDPGTGEEIAVLKDAHRTADALCAVTVDGRQLLAVGSVNRDTVRLWDPSDGQRVAVIDSDELGVDTVCAVTIDGRELLAIGCETPEAFCPEGPPTTVRLCDPRDGRTIAIVDADAEGIAEVCAITVDGRGVLAFCGSGGFREMGGTDGTVRLWDPRDDADALFKGNDDDAMKLHKGSINTVCAITVDGRELLASGGEDDGVRLWNPNDGGWPALLDGDPGDTYAACAVTVDGRELLATGCEDGTVRLWNPRDGQRTAVLKGHQHVVWSVCAVTVDGRELLASGSKDATVRLWDPRDGRQVAVLEGHQKWVTSVCPVTVGGRALIASGSDDGTVRLWDPRDGQQVTVIEADQGDIMPVCAVAVDGRELLASGGRDGTVRLWDLRDGQRTAVLEGHQARLWSMCTVTVDGQQQLATGSWDKTVRLWNPRDGQQTALFEGHEKVVTALCTITVDGRALLASASWDDTVRLWDPHTRTCTTTVPTRYDPNALVAISGSLAIGGDAGILVVDPNAS